MALFITKAFNDLTVKELYELLRLRSEVFVVEQQCAYLDMDGLDPQALHVLGYEGADLVACTRLFAPGICYTEASIGRVATHADWRGRSLGKELMQVSIEALTAAYGATPIKIGAQQYLERFYNNLGFETVSGMYLEDNIPHIKMLRQ